MIFDDEWGRVGQWNQAIIVDPMQTQVKVARHRASHEDITQGNQRRFGGSSAMPVSVAEPGQKND